MTTLLLGAGYVGKALLKEAKRPFIATTTSKERIPELQALTENVLLLEGNNKEEIKKSLKQLEAAVILVSPKDH